jgi:hypothetical protein
VFDEARDILFDAQTLVNELKLPAAFSLEGSAAPAITFDYSFPSYDELEALAESIAREIDDVPIPALEHLPSLYTADSGGMILADTRAEPGTEKGARHWIGKLFGCLGFGEAYKDFLGVLEAEQGSLLEFIAVAFRKREWSLVKVLLKKLLSFLMSSAFLKKLAEKIGETAAAKLLGKIAAKFVPFVGWALLIGSIIWGFAEEFV